MDGSPQVVRFDVTTLWHFDAAEWAPSTASKAAEVIRPGRRCMSAAVPKADVTWSLGSSMGAYLKNRGTEPPYHAHYSRAEGRRRKLRRRHYFSTECKEVDRDQ
jgi:hypothetical protein